MKTLSKTMCDSIQLKSILLLSLFSFLSVSYGQNLKLESFPGAPGVVYLDFDGESGFSGAPVSSVDPANVSNEWIEEIFYAIAEDYSPFNINVTTDRSVYDEANRNSRQMVLFNTTYPAGPGVALVGSFGRSSDAPCFVRIDAAPIKIPMKAANVGSHEAGHTFGLVHDGKGTSVEYYSGHKEYRAIMGTVTNGYSQWSKGEYEGANNSEDDLAIISKPTNNVGYRIDDHGDDINGSSVMVIQRDGSISEEKNHGIITGRTDLDLFKGSRRRGYKYYCSSC